MIYTFKSESFRDGRASKPAILPETTTSISETSWAERVRGSSLVRINHDGHLLEFVQTPQHDGSVRPGTTLLPQRPLESRKELNVPPLFAGSLWFHEQLRYLQKHADRVQPMASSTVNGVPVEVLELAVPAEDARHAFHVIMPNLKQGGTIRLSIAPQLGFVLPRVELLTTGKQVAQVYEATDFNETAPGIYFPSRLWMESRDADQRPRYRAEFAVRCELINEPIPSEDFVVDLPLGTHVQDAQRPGQVINFMLSEPANSASFGEKGSGSFLGFFDRWKNAMIVGAIIGTIASLSLLHASRRQHRRNWAPRSAAGDSRT